MKQRNLSVAEHEKEFNHLSKYAPKAVLIEAFRCRQFEDGLHDFIKRYLAPVTSLQQVNFYRLVQAAMKVERLETSSKEKSQKKKFAKGASSSFGKRVRDVRVESVQGPSTRGRRQGGTTTPSTGRSASVGQGEIPECPHFHRRHLGVYRLVTGGASDVEALNILWQIVLDSQKTIDILRVTVEGGLWHHRRLEIEVEVEGARASIEDDEAQCQR